MSEEDLVWTTYDLKGDFEAYLPTYQDTFKELADLFTDWYNIEEVFDAGCGYGASTLALGRILSKSQIWTVSIGDEPLEEVRREMDKRLHFEPSKIMDFLRKTSKTFGLVFFGRVPFSGITTESEYRILYSRVKRGGYVLMLGDRTLKDDVMDNTGFEKLDFPKGTIAQAYMDNGLWIKR